MKHLKSNLIVVQTAIKVMIPAIARYALVCASLLGIAFPIYSGAQISRADSVPPRLQALALNLATRATGVFMSPMFADSVVGDTRDACRSGMVRLAGKNGEQAVPPNANNVPVELPAMTREIYWYCGGSRERSANGTPFNKVLVTRKNGGIHWIFVVETGAAASSGPVRVGDSKDACDSRQIVTLHDTKDPVSVKAGEIKTGEFSTPTREIFWSCGNSNERVANPLAFNHVQIERAGNGAIAWVFYRDMSITDANLGSFFHNAQGNIFIDVPQAPAGQQQSTLAFKQLLDNNWNSQRTALTAQLLAPLAQAGLPVQNVQVTLSNASKAELRLRQDAQAITFKYVVHENHARATKSGGAVDIEFDVEAVFALPRTRTLDAEQTKQATAFVRHVEIEGDNFVGDVVVGALKSKIRAFETKADSFTKDLPQVVALINAQIAQLTAKIPVPANQVTLNLNLDGLGNIDACATVGKAQCSFAPPAGSLVAAQMLDPSNDQCSANKIWLWDSELGRYVPVSKGQSGVLVQVDNRRFEWYCGDDGSPDPSVSNQESASGPAGTFQVRVRRDRNGRGIHWEFLSWH